MNLLFIIRDLSRGKRNNVYKKIMISLMQNMSKKKKVCKEKFYIGNARRI